MTEEVAELVKAARYAQIEGDLKVAVVKLEQAMRLEPDNPVVLYYYGLTYEWLRNADKSREFFLKVYTQREKAGKYFARAARHLQAGFSSPADLRGDMSFGTILEYRDPECPAGGARQADGAYSDEGWPECQAGGFARHCPVF